MMAAMDQASWRGELRRNEPMSRHTTWRVGGPAERFYMPADVEDLALFLSQEVEGQSIVWLGLGSNVLVSDAGVQGTVIATSGLLNNMSLVEPQRLRVEAGVACAKVAKFGAKNDLIGVEFLAGIPGTMGGALAMNAGAFGGETWEYVAAVETMDARGQIKLRQAEEFRVAYRSVDGLNGEWFIAAYLDLTPGDGALATQRIKKLLERRGQTQPTGCPTCGSVFRNPEGDYAGRLIEACGLKGHCVGGACISEKHANFIVNTGSACAAEIYELINKAASEVKQKFGVVLEPEVKLIGDFA